MRRSRRMGRRLVLASRVGRQFVGYSVAHREWWLLGVVVVLAFAATLISAGHAVAPYTIYSLF